MAISSRLEIRTHIKNHTDQTGTTIDTLINDWINVTLNEINEPGWAFSRNEVNHLWSWLRRKTTFTTTASTADYVLPRDVDKVAIVTQRDTPIKLTQVTDEQFLENVPDPTDLSSANPRLYTLWESSGVSTELAVADTVDVVSSSTSDANDTDMTVTVWGYVGGIIDSESYTLNGTTTVSGSKTFQAREVFVSKSKATTGTITVTENSGGTTLTTLGPEERNPIFKVMTLIPTPSSTITMYVQFYTRIRELTNDGDTPQFDPKWHYVVRLGTLAKLYNHLGKNEDYLATQALYASGVRAMVESDKTNPDLMKHLKRQNPFLRKTHDLQIHRSEADIS